MSYLGLFEERIHEDKIDDVVCNHTLVVDFSGHKTKVRATLDS